MKILVVGYACSPVGGSEPGVGWAAVCRIARKHDVWVLTDVHNRPGWDKARTEGKIPDNVRVRFLREKSACSGNRFLAHVQSWLNYRSFNRRVLDAARDWHHEVGFDLCHQVTIAAWRMPSPLWRLPIPFVWGPIGGAGYIPPRFRTMLSSSARMFERMRDWQTSLALRSKDFLRCIRNTSVVFVANEETENLLKDFRTDLPTLRLPIASVHQDKAEAFRRPNHADDSDAPLRLFAGGNIEGRKGVSLAIRALAIARDAGVSFHYTVAGGGPEIPALIRLSSGLGLDQHITFHPGFKGEDYLRELHRSHVYFLPSFRESTPVTLIEAYLAGCYPVVADTSAQGEIVRLAGGSAIPVDSVDGLVGGLADAIIWCSQNRTELSRMAARSSEIICRHFSSDRYDAMLDHAYKSALRSQPPP